MEACRDPPCHAKHQPRQNEPDGHWHPNDVVDPTSLEEGEDTIHQEGAGQKDGEGECQVSESTLTILLWRPSPYHCFHSRPLLQVCTLSSCPTVFWQRWRLPSSAIFSFTQHGFFPRGHLSEAKATGPPAELIGDNTHRSHGPGLLEASRTSSAVAWNERFPTKRLVSITHLLPHAGPSVYEPRRRRPCLRAGLEGPSPGSRVQLDHVTVFHRMLTPQLLSVESGSGPSVAKPIRRHRRLLKAAPISLYRTGR